MIEVTIREYLKDMLGVPVYMEEPEDPPSEYVRVEKTGSSVSNHIYSATIAIQSYGTGLYEAIKLNESVKEAMEGVIVRSEVISCKLNSDYNFTDIDTHRHRYQAIFDINHY